MPVKIGNTISKSLKKKRLKIESCHQGRIKGEVGPGQFSLQGPYDVIHDVIVRKNYVFTDSQRSPFFFR